MENKKGFTLIELLAVIVILAVIMVIAVPKILDVIESSRESAADSSLKLVRSAIKTQVTTASMSSANFTKEDGCYLFDFTNNNSNVQNLSLKNKDKVSGSIKYCSGKLNDDTLTWDGQTSNKEPEKPEDVLCTGKCTIDADENGIVSVGDTISIGEENFYVISNNGSTISILAYFNLNTGGTYDKSSSTWAEYENPTYIQDETMKGFDVNSSNANIRYGTVSFADKIGWEYENNETIDTSHYNSYLRTALEKYSEIITKSMGKTMTARLIKHNELKNLGCSDSNNTCTTSSYSWIYSSTYWTGSAHSSYANCVWGVVSNGLFNNFVYSGDDGSGVRPVFDILTTDL